MASFESTVILGNVGREPNFKYTQTGKAVCDFSVAVSQGKDKPSKWYRVTVWGELAERVHSWIAKGAVVLCSGSVDVHAYTDKQGNAAATLELTAFNVQVANGKQDSGSEPAANDDIAF